MRTVDLTNDQRSLKTYRHKAQGSQFKRVIFPVTRSRLLDRALIYTALTRGIEQVVFIGDRHAFDRAIIAEPHSQERRVGFSV